MSVQAPVSLRREHEYLNGALDELAVIAEEDGALDLVEFAERLKLHTQVEEDVLYPAALLVGSYVKLQLRS